MSTRSRTLRYIFLWGILLIVATAGLTWMITGKELYARRLVGKLESQPCTALSESEEKFLTDFILGKSRDLLGGLSEDFEKRIVSASLLRTETCGERYILSLVAEAWQHNEEFSSLPEQAFDALNSRRIEHAGEILSVFESEAIDSYANIAFIVHNQDSHAIAVLFLQCKMESLERSIEACRNVLKNREVEIWAKRILMRRIVRNGRAPMWFRDHKSILRGLASERDVELRELAEQAMEDTPPPPASPG